MSGWVRIFEWVTQHEHVPIERLRLPRPRHYRIRAHEATQRAAVIAGVEVHQPGRVRVLACKGALRRQGAVAPPHRAVRIVPLPRDHRARRSTRPTPARRHARAAQVIGVVSPRNKLSQATSGGEPGGLEKE
jgi:hypothetical protein